MTIPELAGDVPDYGGDVLRRFRYQAEIAIAYCISAVLPGSEIEAVIPEFLEDIALLCTGGRYRFLQVKSRNEDLGLWTWAQLVGKKGALRSLMRTHRCAGNTAHSLELVLEGACKRDDPIQQLKDGGDRSALLGPVMAALEIEEAEASTFLALITLNSPPPQRSAIAATNQALISSQAPDLNGTEIARVHSLLVDALEDAMRAERIGALWPRTVVHPARRSSDLNDRIVAKTLSRDKLKTIFNPSVASPRRALTHLVTPGSEPLSALNRKMLEGGAPDDIIYQARVLQANAQQEHLVRAARGRLAGADQIGDLHLRLKVHAEALVARHHGAPAPARLIWADLLDACASHATTVDQYNLLHRDPMLLLGEACDLSNNCTFAWGRSTDDT
jgi:hypothetical protein